MTSSMTHNDFVVLVSKKTGEQNAYYLPLWDRGNLSWEEHFKMEFGEEESFEMHMVPVAFENWTLDTLVEVLGNIMEDANWHSRAEYEPRLLADSMMEAGVPNKVARLAYRSMMEGFERQIG